jgi:hypothetical protein
MDGQEIAADLDVSGSYFVVDQVGSGTYVFSSEIVS